MFKFVSTIPWVFKFVIATALNLYRALGLVEVVFFPLTIDVAGESKILAFIVILVPYSNLASSVLLRIKKFLV